MTDTEKQQRFVCLRAEGWSLARIAEDLDISKTTLVAWSRKFQYDINNQRAIFLETLQDKWLATLDLRVNAIGAQLQRIESELATRDVSTLSTGQLFSLAGSLRRQIKHEIGDLKFSTPVSKIPRDEFVYEVQNWKP